MSNPSQWKTIHVILKYVRPSEFMSNGPIFTDTEQFIVSYYRSKRMSPFYIISGYVAYVTPAILFAYAGFSSDDKTYLLVAFTLLLYCIISLMYKSCKYAGVLKSVIQKYDDRINDLSTK
jgi:hypothetical protein